MQHYDEEVPEKLQIFMDGLLSLASQNSFLDFCKIFGIDYDKDWNEIKRWFAAYGIRLKL